MIYLEARSKLTQAMIERNFVANTMKRYNSVLRNFFEFSKVTDALELNEEMAKSFMLHKQTVDASALGTLHNFNVALKFIFANVIAPSKDRTPNRNEIAASACAPKDIPSESLTLEAAMSKFLFELELRGLSPSTQNRYISNIQKFATAINKEQDVMTIHADDVRNYLHASHYQKNLKPSTCNLFRSSIKLFFCTVLEKDWVEMKIRHFKQDSPIPNILSREQVLSLIKEIKDPMYKMIAILMYSAGLRVSEAVRLRISDVRRSNLQLYIHNSKRGKSRYSILSKNALACLERYYRMYKPKNYFFESPALQDFHIAVESVQKHIKLAAMKIGVDCTPHTLRHCFATHLLESGANILYLKTLMGHSSIKTTAQYVHLLNLSGMNVVSPLDMDVGVVLW